MKTPLLPIFDNLSNVHTNHKHVKLPDPIFEADFSYTLQFLKSYSGSEGTFNSYRRETERLLQWAWHVKQQSISTLKRDDIEQFIRFCQHPPQSWIGLKKVPRYVNVDGLRQPNTQWRPFVATLSKQAFKQGQTPDVGNFQLSQGAIAETFAILSTFYNFLIAEEYVMANPIALIRQKSKYIRKKQHSAPIRRLSQTQWEAVLHAAEQLASEDPEKHERTRFILSALFGMYLRISELAASERWSPCMNDFSKDSQGSWWFTTVGKGNKERQVAVSDAMLESLTRWRLHLGLTPLPSAADNSPLIPKIKGQGPISDTAPIRRIVQRCFDEASITLRKKGLDEEADNLNIATVHWLRHTGISEDVKIRPREHVRDDAGHRSSATTDRYIDIEKQERYKSARHKIIEPMEGEHR